MKKAKELTPDQFRKMQLVELDMLVEFDRVCRKNNIRYVLFGGSLLGAVRHKGYIPWDDDLDLFLPWPDYKKLLELAPGECQYPYFFQSFQDMKWLLSTLKRHGG